MKGFLIVSPLDSVQTWSWEVSGQAVREHVLWTVTSCFLFVLRQTEPIYRKGHKSIKWCFDINSYTYLLKLRRLFNWASISRTAFDVLVFLFLFIFCCDGCLFYLYALATATPADINTDQMCYSV